jgi:aspartate-semialdehyde dehydrogenase
MNKEYDVAIIGATGIVGEAFVSILQQRKFPVRNLYLLASEKSAGKRINFEKKYIKVTNLADFDFSKVQFAFFSAGSSISAEYAPKAAEQGCVVIDNTSQFRYENDIPLVVPEVNPKALECYRERNIIANPNCSTIQLVMALKPIYDAVGISRIDIVTYQAVSGSGKKGIEELAKQTADLLNGHDAGVSHFPRQIAFNVLPQIDEFQENGFTREEMKIVWETHKILEDNTIIVNPTAVRVPVFFGHSEAVHIQTSQAITAQDVILLLKQAPGVYGFDDNDYPTAFTDAANQDDVFVGRVRQVIDDPYGINLWIVADNVRKGAALNAVQIAELLIDQDFYLH